MFLTDKQRPVVPLFPAVVSQSHPFPFDFDAALSSRLHSLLPIPIPIPIPIPSAPADSYTTSCLSWLSRASHLLSLTLSHALHLLPISATTPSLDSTTLALLHSCNALSALSHALLHRLLFLRFSLHSHNPTVIFPQKKPLPELSQLTTPRLHPPLPRPPHGKIDPVQNAIYAVEAVSALVIRAIWVTLTEKGAEHLKALNPIDAEVFAWGKDFNELLEAVLKRIQEEEDRGCGAGSVDAQLEKMEAMTMAMVVGEGKGGMEAMEAACEEMREGVEKLEAAVNAVFQAALSARNAAPKHS